MRNLVLQYLEHFRDGQQVVGVLHCVLSVFGIFTNTRYTGGDSLSTRKPIVKAYYKLPTSWPAFDCNSSTQGQCVKRYAKITCVLADPNGATIPKGLTQPTKAGFYTPPLLRSNAVKGYGGAAVCEGGGIALRAAPRSGRAGQGE